MVKHGAPSRDRFAGRVLPAVAASGALAVGAQTSSGLLSGAIANGTNTTAQSMGNLDFACAGGAGSEAFTEGTRIQARTYGGSALQSLAANLWG